MIYFPKSLPLYLMVDVAGMYTVFGDPWNVDLKLIKYNYRDRAHGMCQIQSNIELSRGSAGFTYRRRRTNG